MSHPERLDLVRKLIICAIAWVYRMPRARETALVRTKLQEALMWLEQFEAMNNAQG